MTLIQRNVLLLVGQVLLDHAANLPILVEMLADRALLVQRTADGLRRATDSTVRYIISTVSIHLLALVQSSGEEANL